MPDVRRKGVSCRLVNTTDVLGFPFREADFHDVGPHDAGTEVETAALRRAAGTWRSPTKLTTFWFWI